MVYRARYPLPDLAIYNLTLPLEILTILSIFIIGLFPKYGNTYIDPKKALFVFFMLFVFLMLLEHSLGMAVVYADGNVKGQLVNLVRMFLYLFVTVVFAKFYFDFKIFQKVLFGFSLWIVMVSVVIHIFFPAWFSDVGYGIPRPMLLLSEPSAFAPIVTFLFFTSLIKKHVIGMACSILLIYFLASGTVLVVFAITGFLFLVFCKRAMFIMLIVVSIPLALFNADKINSTIEESHLLSRISGALMNTDVVEGEGGTARLITFFNLYSELKKDNRVYLGRGFNSAKVFFGNKWEFREFGLLHFYLFSFGIVGLFIMLFIVFSAFIKVYRSRNVEFLVMFIPFVLSSLINSAQGTVLHKFAYLFVFVAFMHASQLSQPNEKRIA